MKKIDEFLKESNAIEGVYDEDSLDQAKYAWEYLEKQKEITSGVVLKAHKILMLHQPLKPNEKGYFRRCQVWIGGREGAIYHKVPDLMDQWVLNANDVIINGKNEPKDFLRDLIKQQHVKFEEIHPFLDGNGRVGRLLMLWQMTKCGLPTKIILAKNRLEYYKWFQ